jgi:hypothetical protein
MYESKGAAEFERAAQKEEEKTKQWDERIKNGRRKSGVVVDTELRTVGSDHEYRRQR